MPLYFITGIASSGKSAVCKELKSRGFEAYDTDDDGLSKWQNISTGYVHPKSSVKPEQRTVEFLKSHAWNIPDEEWEMLSKRAISKPVFICGVADNAGEHTKLIKQIFALSIDEKTLKHRITSRTNNDWGKQPHELESTLDQQTDSKNRYKKAGFTMVDATQPLEKVVKEILAKIQQ